MRVYRQVFRFGMAKALQYRGNYYLGLLSVIFPLGMQYFLWKGIFASAGGGFVFGYTFPSMLMYSFFACLMSKILSVEFVYEINTDIKNGGLTRYLVRPVNHELYSLFGYLGEKVSTMGCSFGILLAVYLAGNLYERRSVPLGELLCFFAVVALSVLLNFLIYYAAGGMAFWMRDASGAIFIVTLVGNIVSGGIFPLDIFPAGVQHFLKILPFSYTNYFPVSILCGSADFGEIQAGILTQLVWNVLCWAVGRAVWRAGLKVYTAVGG